MEDNPQKIELKKNNYANKTHREFFIKKIKIKNNPKIKRNLDLFFNDTNKYFETTYDNKVLVMGKNFKDKRNKTTSSFSENSKKKLFKKMSTLKKYNNLKNSAESEKKSGSVKSRISKNITEEKKKNFATEENQLKMGQRFIDDKELDSIIKAFKDLKKINKYKIKDFITLKELSKSKNITPFNITLKERKLSSLLDNNNDNISRKESNSINLKIKEKIKNASIKDKTFSFDKDKDSNLNNTQNNIFKNIKKKQSRTLNDLDYYKTYSTGFTSGYKNREDTGNKDFSIKQSSKKIRNIIMMNNKKERIKLFEKQNQYISERLNDTIKKEMAYNLALQEKTLLYQNKKSKIQTQLINYLSKKLKKSKNKLLLFRELNYRPNFETKIKLNNLENKLNPDKIYNWFNDLHPTENSKVKGQYLLTEETIRHPQHMKSLSPVKLKLLENSEYIKKSIPLTQLENLKKNLGKIQNSYDTLHINGVDLLKLEADNAKKLKGRKILNDYEKMLNPSSFKSKDILSNVGPKIFRENTISSMRINDY